MRKALSLLFLILIPLCAFAEDVSSVRTAFPSRASKAGILPVDRTIGQTCSPDESEVHRILYGMLGEPYSLEWTESHIAEDVRAALVRLFGSWLSDHLGTSDIIMSVGNGNSDGSFGISVRMDGSCIAFVLKDSLIVSMKEL